MHTGTFSSTGRMVYPGIAHPLTWVLSKSCDSWDLWQEFRSSFHTDPSNLTNSMSLILGGTGQKNISAVLLRIVAVLFGESCLLVLWKILENLERRLELLNSSHSPAIDWLFPSSFQITETSLRVLGNDTSSRDLRAEWKLPFPPPDPPRNLRCSEKIHHAALTPEGALLVSGAAVHSVEMDCFGVPHTIASSDRPHQVLAFHFLRLSRLT